MHEFDRQKMLRLINSDSGLTELYLEQTAKNGHKVEDALSYVFLAFVAPDAKYRNKYEAMFNPVKDDCTLKEMIVQLGPDSAPVAEIRQMVNKYGWRGFIQALAQYAYKKSIEKKALGLTDDVAAWASIHDKFLKLRKGAKL